MNVSLLQVILNLELRFTGRKEQDGARKGLASVNLTKKESLIPLYAEK